MTDKSEPKFMPAPWRMPPCCTIHMDKPSCVERYSPLIKSGADVVCGLVNVRVADAALLVAAPEMYEMLTKCLDYISRCPMMRNAELEDAINALLAKARGEGGEDIDRLKNDRHG